MALAAPYRRSLIWIVASIAIVVAACIAGWIYIDQNFESADTLDTPRTLMLAPGSGVWEIAEALYEAGVVEDPNVFAVGVWQSGHSSVLKAGEYVFPPGVTPRQAMEIIRAGRIVEHRLTIPEGVTSADIGRLLESAEALAGDVAEIPPEGALLPETYFYRRGDSRADLLHRMEAGMHRLMAKLWPNRAANLPFDTPEQALVLASIVEKETALAAERPQVAGVFVNRLRRGMRLQSDPTVMYAVSLGQDRLLRPLTRADLNIDSPFNTYRVKGLPPTPIANPGYAAIKAAIQPLATLDLYFVADGSGGHAFAQTLREHSHNVAKWQRLKRSP